MSVRRLAEEAVQPAAFAFNEAMSSEADRWIAKYPQGRQASAVIPLLMLAQEQDGWVTRAAIESIALMLGMPFIRVLEVATFYTQFQLLPVGTRAHIQVCGTTPCMLRGSGDLIDLCKKRIHAEPLHPNAEGTLSWEEVECQGACVNAPMVMIFKDTYEDLTAERLSQIIDAFEAGEGASITPGPQVDRIYSAPEGGRITLKQDPANAPRSGVTGAPKSEADSAATPPAPVEAARPVTGRPVAGGDANRPLPMERPAEIDNLKMISGIGPKIEGTLHDIGVYTFAQIAQWTQGEREWVDGYLNFKGRIERDDWVKQAEILARGDEDEYVRVFGKKPR